MQDGIILFSLILCRTLNQPIGQSGVFEETI